MFFHLVKFWTRQDTTPNLIHKLFMPFSLGTVPHNFGPLGSDLI